MKIIKKFFFLVVALLIVAVIGLYFFLNSTKPQLSGSQRISGLSDEVKTYFDNYGVPHIQAQNAEDAYVALGYLHAQDRLFQMEMLRRLCSGRLSEILGKELIEVDKLMLSLGLKKSGELSAAQYLNDNKFEYQRLTKAYIKGVNQYVKNGKTPIEFTLMGIKKESFVTADIYATIAFMSLGFSPTLKDEPTLSNIKNKLGVAYANTFRVDALKRDTQTNKNKIIDQVFGSIYKNINETGIAIWGGSNAWVVSPKKSKTGSALLANDTHIQFAQPSVFWEAHISYPGFDFYGDYLAGIPFAVLGQTPNYGWGLTVFPVDNMDLYYEQENPENKNQYMHKGEWKNYEVEEVAINVKGEKPYIFTLKKTVHGPIISNCKKALKGTFEKPISICWTVHKVKSTVLEGLCKIARAKNIDSFKNCLHTIDIVGQNVLYADKKGNIAWWATGKMPIKPNGVHSKFILDGSSGKNDWQGFYSFDKNPHEINPDRGFISSANNNPDIKHNKYPGYYLSEGRIGRINKLLNSKDKLDIEDFKRFQRDDVSDVFKNISQLMVQSIKANSAINKKDEVLTILENWDGGHDLKSKGAVIYSKMIYNLMRNMMADELDSTDYQNLLNSSIFYLSIPKMVQDSNSVWWDNINTLKTETRDDIIWQAWLSSKAELNNQLGKPKNWAWGNVHTLTHNHPLGKVQLLKKYFSVGPFAVTGGNSVINKMSFLLNSAGVYSVKTGPSIRKVVDMASVFDAESIIPTGNSGNIMSKHYKDQAQLFVDMKYRSQLTNWDEIKKYEVLRLNP